MSWRDLEFNYTKLDRIWKQPAVKTPEKPPWTEQLPMTLKDLRNFHDWAQVDRTSHQCTRKPSWIIDPVFEWIVQSEEKKQQHDCEPWKMKNTTELSTWITEHKFNVGDCVKDNEGDLAIIKALPTDGTKLYEIKFSDGVHYPQNFWVHEQNLHMATGYKFSVGDRFKDNDGDCGVITGMPGAIDSRYLVDYDDTLRFTRNCSVSERVLFPEITEATEYKFSIGDRVKDREGDYAIITALPTSVDLRYEIEFENHDIYPATFWIHESKLLKDNVAVITATKEYPHRCPICQAPSYNCCVSGKTDCSGGCS